MDLSNVKQIIFDLGGVILDIDYHLTIKAFQQLGISDFDLLYSQMKQSDLFDDIETGAITPDAFRNKIRIVAQQDFSDQAIDDAWNALLLHLPPHRIEILKRLQSRYRLFLLSNTNVIHYEAYTRLIQQENGIDGLEPLFEKTYYSHEMGLRKPDPKIFTTVLEAHDLKAEETLFIDDSPQHIESAQKLGLQTYHLVDQDIRELFPA